MKVLVVILFLSCLLPESLANKLKRVEEAVINPLQGYDCCVTVYSNSFFTGYYATFCEDQPYLDDGWNDKIVSLEVTDGCNIKVFEDIYYQGSNRTFDSKVKIENLYCLEYGPVGGKKVCFSSWGNQISSFILTKS